MSQSNPNPTVRFDDPKIAFLLELKNRVAEINRDFFNYATSKAAYKIAVTLQCLDIPDKPEFKEIKRLQTEWQPEHYSLSPFKKEGSGFGSRNGGLNSDEIHKINRLFNEFLNQTYFKGFSKGGQPSQPYYGDAKL